MSPVDAWASRVLMPVLDAADVRVGGDRPWDISVHDRRLWRRVLLQGSLGFGDAYIEGWWDCERVDELVARLLSAPLPTAVQAAIPGGLASLRAMLLNLQTLRRAFRIGRHHYDLGNDLYASMLDRRMTYSCAYWKGANDLDEAQEAKLHLIARKIGLRPGMRVLDVGCGWGSFATFAAERYKADVVGVTVSHEQAEYARKRAGELPVEIRFADYREIKGETFDRVVSVGMFEHVGPKNHRRFMRIAHGALKQDGILLLHTIGRCGRGTAVDPWIEKHVFPNSALPSASQVSVAAEGLFVLEDWHNFGQDYDRTLAAWNERFEAAWPQLNGSYGERFRRMWRFYLLSCAGAFRARKIQLWQVVLAKDRGVPGGHVPVR